MGIDLSQHLDSFARIQRCYKIRINSIFFTFNNICYKQIHGTPMGSPLFPIIADLVLQDLEMSALKELSI